jgi:hypothetical protein
VEYYFSINLTYEQFLPYYRGQAQALVVTSLDGQRIQFPAMHMRKFLTPSGIQGNFCLQTKNNKFSSLTKLS